MSTQSWVSMMQKFEKLVAVVCSIALVFGSFTTVAFAATGVPRIMNYQGRLMDSSGTLLGGAGGTDYCVKFSLYDSATVGSGTKLWPSGSPSQMTVTVRSGIFNAGIGDTNAGGDTLDFNFEDNDAVYLNVDVATKTGGTCGTFETLSPRQRVTASGYAINSATLNGKNGAYYLANGFSTTSAAFSLSTYDKSYFFSTTSVVYWDAQQARWATTSSDAWLATKTTDNLAQGSINKYYSNTAVSDFVGSSSTIAKTFTNNTFTGTNSFQNDVALQNATTSNFSIANTISGAGLISCSGSSDKLIWNASTRQFGCGADAGAGGGITAIGAQYSVFQTGSSQTFATSSDTNIGLEITSASDTHTFKPTWIGTLAAARGGTGIGSVTQNGILIGGTGNTWTQVGTSSLGLPTYGDLGAYMGLAAWYATTTDALGEGSVHLYFTPNRVASVLAGTTTDAIAEGSTNKYYHDSLVQNYLNGISKGFFFSTSSALQFASAGLAFSTTSSDYWKSQTNFHSTSSLAFNLSTYDKGYFFSTTSVNFWESTQNRWATTSSDAWLATKSTSDLPEGSNLYYTPNRVAGVIAGTTTDALAEGATNKYFTATNADAYLNAKDKGYFFSTTSAIYFNAQNPGASFSTSSADYWKLQNNFHSTSSFAYDLSTYDKGYFFSTSSVNFWDSQQFRWATTSSDAWLATKSTTDLAEGSNLYYTPNRVAGVIAGTTTDALAEGSTNKYFHNSLVQSYLGTLDKGFFFSTTSSDYWKTQNNFFSTTSTDFWKSQSNFFSTTSASAFLAQNQGAAFSTTSASNFAANGLAHSTTSVAYQLSQNVTLGNATSTSFFANSASTTNINSNTASVGSATIGALTTNATTTGNNGFNLNNGCFAISGTCITSAASLLGSNNTWTGTNGFQNITATNATSTTFNTNVFGLASNYFTSFLGNGLQNVGGVLTVNQGQAFSTSSASNFLAQNQGQAFSTTSASNFAAAGLAFSTTSSDYWSSQRNFFSTTSANAWSSLGLGFSTSSANFWSGVGLGFSTTSASNFLAQNQGAAYSTTSENYYQHSSSTVVTTYKNNTFTGTNGFQNITATGATTTSLSTGIASTTNAFISGVSNALLSTGANGAVQSTSFSGPLTFGSGVLAISQASSTANGYLSSIDWNAFNSRLSTSTLALFDKGFFFSTTSASAFLAQNQGAAFSTTSASNFAANGLAHSTTSVAYQLSQNVTLGNATSTSSYAATASSTNLFSNLATIGSAVIGAFTGNTITATNATSTTFSANFASTSALNSNTASVGSATIGALTTNATTTGNNGFNLNNGCFAISGTCITSAASLLGSNNTWTGTNTFNGNVTLTNATSTTFNTNVFGLASNYFTSFLGNGLQNVAGVLTVNQGQAFSTSSASAFLAQNQGAAFSTTSASNFAAAGLAFSTTSTDYWQSQRNFFSTTSSDFWQSQRNFFSTSSASYFSSLGFAFSTSSASAFLAQNQGAAFSTSSASNFLAQNTGNAFSTTSASNFAAAGLAYSTTSENYYQHSSSTVVTSYKNNTFTGANGFQNITATGATSTSLSTGIASTTNQFISGVSNGLLSTAANGQVQATSVLGPLSFGSGALSIAQASSTAGGYLTSIDWNAFNSRLSTSTLALFDKGFFFSTTSASYFLSQNQGAAFSTTSADAHLVASSSIPKTYTTNTFIGVNNFANITAAGATTTSFFTGTASSTNIFANVARFGSIGAFSLTGAVAAAGNDILGANNASSSNLWISSIRNGLLATNGQGSVVASSTPTASSFNATSNTASQLPYASTTAISALQQLSIGAANGTILQGGASGTSTIAGVINVTGTNSTSTFSGGLQASRLNLTSGTSTAAGGFNLTSGCFAVNGVCVSGAVNSVSAANSTLTVTPNSGNVTVALNLANPNLWTGLQQFSSATSSLLEATKFYASTIVSTSTALVLQSNIASIAGLTFNSTSTQVAAVDTINNRFTIGLGGSPNPSLFVLDTKNTAGDPNGVAGSMYYNSNLGVFRCFDTAWTTCGGTAASSTGDVQFRNVDGSFTATDNFNWSIASNGLDIQGTTTQTTDLLTISSSSGRTMFGFDGMGVMTLASTTDPATPSSGQLDVYAKEIAGRMLPKWVGPSGVDTPFQANLGFNKIVLISSAGAALTAQGATLANVGTLSAGALAVNTLKQSVRRTTVTSAATAGSLGSSRSTTALVARGNAAGIGGFFYTIRFGLTTLQSGNRGFFGLSDSTAAATNVDPTTSTTIGKVGLAFAANTGNWKFVQNVAGTAPAVIDLGANFPINTTDLLELIMYSKPNDTVINYRITNLSTGLQIASSTGTTNIPPNTTYLTTQEWMSNNATAASVAFDLSAIYLESDN